MKKKVLAILLTTSMALGSQAGIAAAAEQDVSTTNETTEWGEAKWIWSSDEEDRGSATRYQTNEYQSFIFDDKTTDVTGLFNASETEHYEDLAAEQDVWMNFRRDFSLDEVPEKAEVKIATDSKYWMYINGKMVVFEGGLKRGPSPNGTYYDVVDIASYLKEGKNDICIQVWYWGGNKGFSYNPSGSAGLLFSSELIDADTQDEIISGDGKWMAVRNPANKKHPESSGYMLTERNVYYDARDEIDWTNEDYEDYEKDGWNTASVIGISEGEEKGYPGDEPWGELEQRPIDQWKDYGQVALEATETEGYPPTMNYSTLADLGVKDTYTITSNLSVNPGSYTWDALYANAVIYLGCALNGDDYSAEYTVKLDASSLYNESGEEPRLIFLKGDEELASTGLADITLDNVTDSHKVEIEVVNEEETEIYFDDEKMFTIGEDLTSTDTGIGFSGDILVDDLKITDDDTVYYETDFAAETEDSEIAFPEGTIADGYLAAPTKMYAINPCYLGYYTYGGTRYQIELPYNAQCVAYFKLAGDTKAGAEISMTTDTFFKSNYKMTYVTVDGEQEYESKAWFNGDYIYFDIPDGITVTEFGYHEIAYNVDSGEDTDFIGYFDSTVSEEDPSLDDFTGGKTWSKEETNADNNFYDELWKKAARTLYVTIRDGFMDCPDRERSQYIGDAVNEMEEGYYSLGVQLNALDAKTVRNIVDWQTTKEINGKTYYLMSNVRPGLNAQEISSQSLGTAIAAWNHYLYAGDLELIQYAYESLYNYLTNYHLETEGTYAGLVAIRAAEEHMYSDNLWDWFDWGNNQDKLLSTNLWWYASAKSVREMAKLDGVPSTDEQIQWLDEMLASIENNFEKFWNEELQAYATTWNTEETPWYSPVEAEDGSHLVDDRANALAVVFGLYDESHSEAIKNVFMGTEDSPAYENASIYMEKYVIQALYLLGYDKDAMTRMEKRHVNDVNVSTSSTLPEYWNMGGTKNHGWSGGSMIALSKYAAGVEPVDSAYETWHVIPQMGYFTSINCRVPSQIGNIDVTIDQTDERTSMTVVSPGKDAEIWIPVSENQNVSVVEGNAEYKGMQEAYQKQYAVYHISEEGTYTFEAK